MNVGSKQGEEGSCPGNPQNDRIDDPGDKAQPESRVCGPWSRYLCCLPGRWGGLLLNRLRLERRRSRWGWVRSLGASLNSLSTIGAKCGVVCQLRPTFRTKHIHAPNCRCARKSNHRTRACYSTRNQRVNMQMPRHRSANRMRFSAASKDTQGRTQKLHSRICIAKAPSLRLVRPTT